MKKVVIYARCSTKEQDTDNQIEQLRRYAATQEFEVVEVLTDNVSGSKGVSERKGLERVFALAHQGKVQVVLFWALDRLSREGSVKTIEYLSRFDSYKVGWHSYTEPYLSSLGIFKEAIVGILAALARQEKVRLAERTRAGLERFRRLNPNFKFGRPKVSEEKISQAMMLKEQGLNLSQVGLSMNITAARACQLVKLGKERILQDAKGTGS